MSYILDALKKSEQDRQQGASPHLLSIHGHSPSLRTSRPHRRRHIFWLIAVGLVLLSIGAGILFVWYRGGMETSSPGATANDPAKAAEQQTSSPSSNTTPLNNLTEKGDILSSSVVIDRVQSKIILGEPIPDMATENPMDVEEQEFIESLPFLKDLPYALQKEVPKLKFAGHTFSKIPSQRMIIINNDILREGDKIDSNTHLKEITWDGVIIDHKNNLFRVNTNK